jgi:hypothetical protein
MAGFTVWRVWRMLVRLSACRRKRTPRCGRRAKILEECDAHRWRIERDIARDEERD